MSLTWLPPTSGATLGHQLKEEAPCRPGAPFSPSSSSTVRTPEVRPGASGMAQDPERVPSQVTRRAPRAVPVA